MSKPDHPPTETASGPTRFDRPPWRGPLLAILGLVLLGPLSDAGTAGAAPVSREYELKAAFLFNFAKFVEWPARRFASPESPIVIGILGNKLFGDELAVIVESRRVNGRTVKVTVVTTDADAGSVHVLYVSSGQEARMRAMIDTLHKNAVLTVGESPAFAAAGGAINFVLEGDKVRFAIDLESGERSDLKISAQLLKLATAVHR